MKGHPQSQKNPDLRRQVQMPGPSIEVLEQSLHNLIRNNFSRKNDGGH
jgi:hypothetical protein